MVITMSEKQKKEIEPNELEKSVLLDITPEIFQSINKNAFMLGLFALISTGLIALTYSLTKNKIAEEVELSLVKQLSEIVPPAQYNNKVYQDCLLINDVNYLGTDRDQKAYRMRNGQDNFALMLTTIAPDGYSGNINIAIAISAHGKILGVNILNHKETPGLGDKIERKKSDWLNQFNGLSLTLLEEKYWRVKKDGGQFDALTGATITPRAVVKAIHNGLIFASKNNSSLFEQPSNCYTFEVQGNQLNGK